MPDAELTRTGSDPTQLGFQDTDKYTRYKPWGSLQSLHD
jgi:hypothetical protein